MALGNEKRWHIEDVSLGAECRGGEVATGKSCWGVN